MSLTDLQRLHLMNAEEQLRAALRAQSEDQHPDHQDFYAWGWLLTRLAELTGRAAAVLATQVGQYEQGRTLRDDAGMEPAERIDRAYREADAIRGYAEGVREHAARFHSEVGHIAVEHPPESEDPR